MVIGLYNNLFILFTHDFFLCRPSLENICFNFLFPFFLQKKAQKGEEGHLKNVCHSKNDFVINIGFVC